MDRENLERRGGQFAYLLFAAQHCVRAWDTGMRTLGKNVLQIQVEVFHTVTTAQNTEKIARIISLY